jgi:hypothetical protein
MTDKQLRDIIWQEIGSLLGTNISESAIVDCMKAALNPEEG